MPLATGTQIGSYEILAHLGAGGMGEVYRARDRRLEREVAIKVLPDRLATDSEALARFEREAKAVAALSHPNILSIHEFGTDGRMSYAVTELLEGVTLRTRLEAGRVPLHTAVDYALQITRGLAVVHDKRIIHRDLKPENIFVIHDGRIKILDFGLAKSAPLLAGENEPTQGGGTEPGTILGTVGYMSPEQVRGREVDHRADIFAVGAIVYEMLSGRRAFRRPSAVETMNAVLDADPIKVFEAEVNCSPALVALVKRCLEKEVRDRFQSARDLASAFESLSSGSRDAAPATVKPEMPSIAVLPFTNLSPDPEQEYFCEGMAEEIINALAKVSGLRVAARTSSFQFKGKALDISRAGEALNVKSVVEGSVRTSGQRLRVTAQLINVADGYHLWSERYDRRMENVFDIQDEIASQIVKALQGALLPGGGTPQVARGTRDLQAYHHYLKARYHRFTRVDLQKAGELYQLALDRDPDYAAAHAGVADSYTVRGFYAHFPPSEAREQSKAAIDRALALDEDLGEAHAILGWVRVILNWDWDGAERAFLRGIELNPAFVPAYSWYGELLSCMGRFDEALDACRKAQELDPLSPHVVSFGALALLFARKYDRAIADLDKLLELHPDNTHGLLVLSQACSVVGQHDRAVAAAERLVEKAGRSPFCVSALGAACGRAGQSQRAEEIAEELEGRSKQEYVTAVGVADVYLGLGCSDDALSWLDRAWELQVPSLAYLRAPQYDLLRSEPRFQALLSRLSL